MNNKRFHTKYKKLKNGCWEWQGFLTYGYGQFWNGKNIRAHRYSWELYNKKKIPKNICVLHKCDNKACVNPKHLFLGTQKDNMQDMIKKKRDNKAKGEKHYRAKLTWKDVKKIRALYATKCFSYCKLAKIYLVNPHSICCVVNNITWKGMNKYGK